MEHHPTAVAADIVSEIDATLRDQRIVELDTIIERVFGDAMAGTWASLKYCTVARWMPTIPDNAENVLQDIVRLTEPHFCHSACGSRELAHEETLRIPDGWYSGGTGEPHAVVDHGMWKINDVGEEFAWQLVDELREGGPL